MLYLRLDGRQKCGLPHLTHVDTFISIQAMLPNVSCTFPFWGAGPRAPTRAFFIRFLCVEPLPVVLVTAGIRCVTNYCTTDSNMMVLKPNRPFAGTSQHSNGCIRIGLLCNLNIYPRRIFFVACRKTRQTKGMGGNMKHDRRSTASEICVLSFGEREADPCSREEAQDSNMYREVRCLCMPAATAQER